MLTQEEKMHLNWIKCVEDEWCPLFQVNLAHPHFNGLIGVYLIWYGGSDARVVYVGQGNIAERLRDHRSDPEFMALRHRGLFVTWAAVSEQYLDGVEQYLGSAFHPLMAVRFPHGNPITVSLPW